MTAADILWWFRAWFDLLAIMEFSVMMIATSLYFAGVMTDNPRQWPGVFSQLLCAAFVPAWLFLLRPLVTAGMVAP